MALQIVPITLREAQTFIEQHHRHSKKPAGHICSLAVADGNRIVGVATVGRPVSRILQDGFTAEVTRCCTDGTPNACSKLYAASWRAARALGYRRLVTYTLKTESGSSLRAAGWKTVAEVRARSWHTPTRPRVDQHSIQKRLRWEFPADPPPEATRSPETATSTS